MDQMRAALDEVIEKVKVALKGESKSPVEILLDQHLPLHDDVVSFSPKNCSTVAIPTFVLTDFVSRTNNIVGYQFIMGRVWDVMVDSQHEPNLLKKALNLLHYLLINGSIQILKGCQDPVRRQFFEALATDYNRVEFEQYKFSKHLDVGAGVRKTAAEIYHLISHERELFHARCSAEKLHQSLSSRGLRSAYPSLKGEDGTVAPERGSVAGISFQDEARPSKYTDSLPTGPVWDEDIGSKIITHTGTVLDDLNRSFSPPESRHSRSSSTTSRTSSGRQGDSRSSSRSSSKGRREHQQPVAAPSLITTSVDLLGLDTLLPPPTPASALSQQQQQQSHHHGAPNDAKSRTRSSHQKLIATI